MQKTPPTFQTKVEGALLYVQSVQCYIHKNTLRATKTENYSCEHFNATVFGFHSLPDVQSTDISQLNSNVLKISST